MTQILDGNLEQEKKVSSLKKSIAKLKDMHDIRPALAIILVGNHEPSKIYVRNKQKIADKLGIHTELFHRSEITKESDLIDLIEKLNTLKKINGILLQLPVPNHIDKLKVLRSISPEKDVDGLHPQNMVHVINQEHGLYPCTPQGCMHLIHCWSERLEDKLAVVIGRSNLVGKPMAALLLNHNATVIQAHRYTKNLPEICRQADIVVSATGQAKMIKQNWIKPGACVIDVGISRDQEELLSGDVDFDAVSQVAGAITPVPGGVGPMTITYLMVNVVKAVCLQYGLSFHEIIQ
jgi:methylenetetrahydrofolate dehydrogenase (NADP+)/methenyltetrahydrofolate cyclohydrolase